MKKILFIGLLCLVVLFGITILIFRWNHKQIPIIKRDYSNINIFWTDFRNAIIASNYKELKELTLFPLQIANLKNELVLINEDQFDNTIKLFLKRYYKPNETEFDYIRNHKELDSNELKTLDVNIRRLDDIGLYKFSGEWRLNFLSFKQNVETN